MMIAVMAREQTRRARQDGRPRDLLAWFMRCYWEETPERLHQQDVWRDRRKPGDPPGYEPVGGSQLGTPRDAEPFRQYIEDDPYALEVAEYDGHKDMRPHYARPLRAALARLAGRGPDHAEYPFMARVLYRTALRAGDWNGACASMGIIEPVRQLYVEAALHKVWARYCIEPQYGDRATG